MTIEEEIRNIRELEAQVVRDLKNANNIVDIKKV